MSTTAVKEPCVGCGGEHADHYGSDRSPPGPYCMDCFYRKMAGRHGTGMGQGWICPRCGMVHAPWARTCGCFPPSVASSGTDITASSET